MKNWLKKIIIAIGTASIIVVILFSPLIAYIFNLNYYLALYEKNGVYASIEKEDAAKLTEDLFGFFRENKAFKPFTLKNDLPYFTANEISHLEDVRILFNKIFLAYYICLGLAFLSVIGLIEKNNKKFLKNISLLLILPSAILIFFLFLLFLFSQNFLPLFDKFHYIFFPQGNFAFPEDSTLITLLPLGFFSDFFERLVISSVIISCVSIISGVLLSISLKKYFKKKESVG
ncbi:MAG: lipoprotein intramolecular transacylase Lit [Candidatus Humimicrobiaceae bacterium]